MASSSQARSTRDVADPGARQRILRGALEVFGDRGFDGARTRDIAEAAGVNLGLLQYYFGGKEKLWRATVDHAFDELWAALDGVGTSGGQPPALADIARVAVRFAASHPALVRLMNDEGKRGGPRLRWLVDHHGRRLYELVSAVLEPARAEGLLPDVAPVHLYFIFIGAMGLIFSQAPECKLLAGVDPTGPATVEAHAEAMVQLLLGRSGASS